LVINSHVGHNADLTQRDEQERIEPAGTAIGLVYCAFLAAEPLFVRRITVITAHGAVLQYTGLVVEHGSPKEFTQIEYRRARELDVVGDTLGRPP
jgi:hypothetical protein